MVQSSVYPEIPASHGLIFPWALPTIGISVPAARSVERHLTRIWLREVGKFAQEFSRRPKKDIMSSSAAYVPEEELDADIFEVLYDWET